MLDTGSKCKLPLGPAVKPKLISLFYVKTLYSSPSLHRSKTLFDINTTILRFLHVLCISLNQMFTVMFIVLYVKKLIM